jgi:hypothetical protein
MDWQASIHEAIKSRRTLKDDQEDFLKALISATEDVSHELEDQYRKAFLDTQGKQFQGEVPLRIAYRGTEEFNVIIRVQNEGVSFSLLSKGESKAVTAGKIQEYDRSTLRSVIAFLYRESLLGQEIPEVLDPTDFD